MAKSKHRKSSRNNHRKHKKRARNSIIGGIARLVVDNFVRISLYAYILIAIIFLVIDNNMEEQRKREERAKNRSYAVSYKSNSIYGTNSQYENSSTGYQLQYCSESGCKYVCSYNSAYCSIHKCRVEGCTNGKSMQGLCSVHYQASNGSYNVNSRSTGSDYSRHNTASSYADKKYDDFYDYEDDYENEDEAWDDAYDYWLKHH